MEQPYISKLQISKPWLAVFLVDGAWVRKNHNVDFVYGGHDLVYNFIPKAQIWLDGSVEAKERPFTLVHELYERYRMDRFGETYDVAHEFAAALEKKYRKDQTGLHEKIQELFDMNKATTKQAFSLPSDNVFRWAIMPGLMGAVGGATGRYTATPEEKLRATLEGAAMGALGGLGFGSGHFVGSKLFKNEFAPYLMGMGGLIGGAGFGRALFPGIRERTEAYQARREAQSKSASFQKQAYLLGYKLAYEEVKEEPTRPTHKNPGPVASEPTSPITSTSKQDSMVTSIVSPKTY